jgi:importin subunit beta-1
VKTLSDILYHGGNSPVARMAAGLQLKNTLTSKDPTIKTQYQQRWLSFPEETRAYVKKNVRLFYITIRNSQFCITTSRYYRTVVFGSFSKLVCYFSSRMVCVMMKSSDKADCMRRLDPL